MPIASGRLSDMLAAMDLLERDGIDPAPQLSQRDYALAGGLLLLGLALRLPGLDDGLWFDEIKALIESVRLPAGEIISKFENLNNHVFYSLTAHACIVWLGESAWTLRLPALVWGVASIPALYYFGRQLSHRREAFLATLFMVANYQHVWFSQNARGYTGLVLGALLTSSLFIRLVADPGPRMRWALAYGVVAALSIWIHLTAAFVIVAHGLVWLVLAIRALRAGTPREVRPGLLAMGLTFALTLVLYAPILVSVVEVTNSGDGGVFVRRSQVTSWVIGEFVAGFTRSTPTGWPLLVVTLVALVCGAASYWRQSPLAASLLVLPLPVALVVISLFAYVFFPRYVFILLPFVLLIAVRGGFWLASRVLPFTTPRHALAIGTALALAGGFMLPNAWKPKQDFAAAATLLEEQRRQGDGVVCLGLMQLPLRDYLGVDCEGVDSLEELSRIEARHARVWLLYTLPTPTAAQRPAIWQRLHESDAYRLIEEFPGSLRGGEIRVLLRSQKPMQRPEQS